MDKKQTNQSKEKSLIMFLGIIGAFLVIYLFSKERQWQIVLIGFIVAMTSYFIINDVQIKRVKAYVKDTGLEVENNVEESRRIAADIQITKDQFDKTITAFLAYNLAETESIGLSFSTTRVEQYIDFVENAKLIVNNSNDVDGKLHRLLDVAQVKTFVCFEYEIETKFIEISERAKDFISTGNQDGQLDLPVIRSDVAIDFESLRKLSSELSNDKRIKWTKLLDLVEDFYKKYF